MNLWYSPYELTPKARLNARAAPGARDGALLRIGNGFADLHPWPELGDAPLPEQLRILSSGGTTPLIEGALRCASLDASARERGVSLFEGLTIPDSHWPAVGGKVPADFDTVKVKCDAGLDVSALEIYREYRLRLDFNATLSLEGFERLAPSLRDFDIDFVEDPFAYEPLAWERARVSTRLRLALDRGRATRGVDVIVHKPALGESLPDTTARVVVTSYMDHPVGQFFAAFEAGRSAARIDATCGLFTHVVYERHSYSELIRSVGAQLLPPEGTGLGFDELLRRERWRPLS